MQKKEESIKRMELEQERVKEQETLQWKMCEKDSSPTVEVCHSFVALSNIPYINRRSYLNFNPEIQVLTF